MTGYDLARGTADGLEGLADAAADSCPRATTTGLTATGLTETPPSTPGDFYWYLVVAKNAVGTGPAGSGRVLDSSGTCP